MLAWRGLRCAKASQKTNKARRKEAEGTASEKDQRHYRKLITNFDDEWFPKFWLTFVLCGKPCGDEMRRSLASGHALDRPSDRGLVSTVSDSGVSSTMQQYKQYLYLIFSQLSLKYKKINYVFPIQSVHHYHR